MKDNTINIRTSEEDQANLKQAAENLSILTDEKPSVSKAIRQGVKILAEQDPNKPELFHVNRKALRDLDVNLEAAQAKLQAIVDEYVKIINTPPTFDKIETWFGSNRSDFLVTKKAILEGHIGSLIFEMCRVKYPGIHFDNIDLPDLDPLYEVCNQLIFIPEVDGSEVIYWQCYRIVKDRVELIPDAVEAVRNTFRTWAISIDEKARLATVKKLCDLLNTIKLPNSTMLNIAGFCAYDGEAGVYAPLEWYVKGYTI